MSIEQHLAANTAAIEALTAALLSGNKLPAAGAPTPLSATLDRVEASISDISPKKGAASKSSKPAAAPATTEGSTPVQHKSAHVGPTYEDVKKLTMDTANPAKGDKRAVVLATLAQFGAKLATDLKPEQYADYIDALNAAVAEAADDLA